MPIVSDPALPPGTAWRLACAHSPASTIFGRLGQFCVGANRPGHWEGDLLCGSHNSQIATLVERQTRYVMLVKVAGKDTETVVNALIENAHSVTPGVVQIPDMGPRQGTSRAQALHFSDRYQGLLLRPTSAVAARLK